jgi:acyl-coenzyme A synthetase/AMP-(fatty) acid ligase
MTEREHTDVITSPGTITETMLEAVAAHPDPGRPALIDWSAGRPAEVAFAEVGALVPAAARGLVRRGVRPHDVGAVCVGGGRDFALAVHALCAAGAVPLVPPQGVGAAELAGLLADSGARVVFAAEPVGAVLEAVDNSYVRQVFAFSDLPGTTPFEELLAGADQGPWPALDPLRDLALRTCDEPAEDLTHADRLADVYRLSAALEVRPSDVVVAARAELPAATWAGLLDVALIQGATLVAVPGAAKDALAAIVHHKATVAVLGPETIRAAAYDHEDGLGPLRVLATAPPPPEVTRMCRLRHGWTVTPLT